MSAIVLFHHTYRPDIYGGRSPQLKTWYWLSWRLCLQVLRGLAGVFAHWRRQTRSRYPRYEEVGCIVVTTLANKTCSCICFPLYFVAWKEFRNLACCQSYVHKRQKCCTFIQNTLVIRKSARLRFVTTTWKPDLDTATSVNRRTRKPVAFPKRARASQLVVALNPVNHKGLYQGWRRLP